MNHTPGLTHSDLYDLNDEIWVSELMIFRWQAGFRVNTGIVKTFGNVGNGVNVILYVGGGCEFWEARRWTVKG